MNLYLTEPGMILRKKGGKYIVEKEDKILKEIPSNLVEAISIYSGATITSKCILHLILNNIYIFWFNASNILTGYIENIENLRSETILKQTKFLEEEKIRLEISKKIIKAKLSNGIIILKRFNRIRKSVNIESYINKIKAVIKDIEKQKSILNLYGIEGIGSREYFKGVAEIVGKDYMHNGREKRPATDPFNSLLNFGYSILYSEIIAMIKQEKISPFYGIMHYVRNGHASLASDLMEEFRYQIIDSLAINIVNNGTFKVEDFEFSNGGVYLNKELRKQYISKIIEKLNSEHKYNGISETYRDSIRKNIKNYKSILTSKNIEDYKEFLIRWII